MNNSINFEYGRAFAAKMDSLDPLKDFRNRFYFPEQNTVYLDGNSLGRLPLESMKRITQLTEYEWGKRLIRSWNEGWYTLSQKVSEKIAAITGAAPGEIATCDSTSVNLYKVVKAALQLNKGRKTIVTDALNFPTDIYVLQGIVNESADHYRLHIIPSDDEMTISEAAIENALDDDTAIVVLSHVAFKSGFMHNMEIVNQLVHSKGALMIWDLSHAGGAVPLQLSLSGADMAVGCTYKYMNGGPGSPAYLFIAQRHQEKIVPAIWGWFGEADPFAFGLAYQPAKDIRKMLIGTPPVISLAAIEPGLDLLIEAGMENIRRKSVLQTEYLIYLYEQMLKDKGFAMGSPKSVDQRGSHVSLQHPAAYPICKALIHPEHNNPVVIPDFRAPDNIRIGIAPLYNSFEDIFAAVECMAEVVSSKKYEKFKDGREAVT
jgi:kynureninase